MAGKERLPKPENLLHFADTQTGSQQQVQNSQPRWVCQSLKESSQVRHEVFSFIRMHECPSK